MSNFISLQQAIALTKQYRKEKEAVLIPDLREKGILPICETFDRTAFETLLNKPGCVSVRVYLGMDTKQKVRVLAVAVNERGEDILPSGAAGTLRGGDDDIVEDGQRCPDICPPPSDLNS